MAAAEGVFRERPRADRLFYLLGAVVAGAYAAHVVVASALLSSRATFDAQVAALYGSGSGLVVLEVLLVHAPLATYGLWGLYRATRRDPEQPHLYASDRLRRVHGASGVVAFVFIASYVARFRFATWFGGLEVGGYSTRLEADLSSTTFGAPLLAVGYLLGVAACAVHFVLGSVASARRHGRSDPRVLRVSAALGALFFVVSAAVVLSLATGTRWLPASAPAPGVCGSAIAPLPPAVRSEMAPAP